MKNIKIDIALYEFSELDHIARTFALDDMRDFMDSIPLEYENDKGEMISEYVQRSDAEIIDTIEINEYLYFSDGVQANIIRYVDNHPLAGLSILTLNGQKYPLN